MGNKESRAGESDSDSEKTEQYTHHVKVLEQVSKPASSVSDSGEDDAYHSASDPERAEVSRHNESDSDNGSDSLGEEGESGESEDELEEEENVHSVTESNPELAHSDEQHHMKVGTNSVEEPTKEDRFMKQQVKPIIGFVESSDSNDAAIESEEEIIMEIDKCLGIPPAACESKTTGKLMDQLSRNPVQTSSSTTRMIDMVSVEASDPQVLNTASSPVKRKISEVEPEVITNANVRTSGGMNRPFKGNVETSPEHMIPKQLKTTGSNRREERQSPKQFKHFNSSPFKRNSQLNAASRPGHASQHEDENRQESKTAVNEKNITKTSLVSAVLGAKEKADSEKISSIQDKKKNDQHRVIYTQKKIIIPQHLLKAKTYDELSGNKSSKTTLVSTPVHDEAGPKEISSGQKQLFFNEKETNPVTMALPVHTVSSAVVESKDKTDLVDVMSTKNQKVSSIIAEKKEAEVFQVKPKATSLQNQKQGDTEDVINVGSGQTPNKSNAIPARAALNIGSEASSLSTEEQTGWKSGTMFGVSPSFSSNINERRVSPTTVSFQATFNDPPTSVEPVPRKITEKPEQFIKEAITQTTRIVSSRDTSTMTSPEEVCPETPMSKIINNSNCPSAGTSQSSEIAFNSNRTSHMESVGSQTTPQSTTENSPREDELMETSELSSSSPTSVPMVTETSPQPVNILVRLGSESRVMPMVTENSPPPTKVTQGHGSRVMTSSSPTQAVSPTATSTIRYVIPQQETCILPEKVCHVMPPRGNVPSTRYSKPTTAISKTPTKRPASPESTKMNMQPSDDDARQTRSGSSGFQNHESPLSFNPERPSWSSFGNRQKTLGRETSSSLSSESQNVETMRNPFYVGTWNTSESTKSMSPESKTKGSSSTQSSNKVNVGIIGQKPAVSAGKPVSLATPRSTVATPFNSFARSHQQMFPSLVSSEEYTKRTDMMASSATRPIPSTATTGSIAEQPPSFKTFESASQRPQQMNTIGRTGNADRQNREHFGPPSSSSPSTIAGRIIMKSQEQPTPAVSSQERSERFPEPPRQTTIIKTEPPTLPPAEVNPLENKGDEYSFELADDLKIHLCYRDLVDQTADAIANFTDGQLTHVNRTSMPIAAAAGNAMINQCQNFLRQNGGPLEKGQVFETAASGTLVGKVSHILHVPTPTWIVENETQSCNDLLKSYLNCLIFASDRLKLKSIAFPLVGSEFPADACINAFFKAMLVFVFEKRPESQLRDISLVIDDFYLAHFCLQMIQSSLEQILLEGIDGIMAEAVNSYYGGSQWERQQNDINQSRLSERIEEDTTPKILFRGPAIKRPKL